MLQNMPPDKKGSFFNINDWNKFMVKLINDFGNIAAFGREVQCQFNHPPRSDSMKELVEILAPKVQQLMTTLNCLSIFHPTNKLHNLTLTLAPNKAIISHLPSAICPQFHAKVNVFHAKVNLFHCSDPDNALSPAIFYFLAKFISKIEKVCKNFPMEYNDTFPPEKVGLKPVCYENPRTRDADIKARPWPLDHVLFASTKNLIINILLSHPLQCSVTPLQC